MAAPPQPSKADPYIWDSAISVPPETLTIWKDVGSKIEENQTVVWEAAVHSLEKALLYFGKCQSSRQFVESYASQIIAILSEQTPSKIGNSEKICVNSSLASGISLVVQDLEIQSLRRGESKLIDGILGHAFSKKKNYYKGTKSMYHHMSASGHPEVRMSLIDKFQLLGGFRLLDRYLQMRVDTPDTVDGKFTSLETMQHILAALYDCICRPETSAEQENDAIMVTKTLMRFLATRTDDDLKKISSDVLSSTVKSLQKLYDRLGNSRRDVMLSFYEFWRSLCLSLIKSTSLPLKLAGWEQIAEMIRAVVDHRPPPKSFNVSGAGSRFVNGDYSFAGQTTAEGYAKPGQEISYVRAVGDDEPEGRGKKLTLFRCTMRSQQKWWFLSEADEDQPGTDRDIDYYQHKSKEHEEALPPPQGWTTCRSGTNPPPNLRPDGVLVPDGEEYNTLEHKLAQWTIENKIVEQVLGDTTIHREIVSRSTVLIKFLATMCTRDPEPGGSGPSTEPNKYCLQTSHLLFAWKTCMRKADAVVSRQVYQLLVTILPLCPSNRSIPLLRAIQESLKESSEERDYLVEVSDFVSELAAVNLTSETAKGDAPSPMLAEDVREEVLILLFSVLIHPNVSLLQMYDNLKRYMAHELTVEPKGEALREKFLNFCLADVGKATVQREQTNEKQALRMVKLTKFILETCPRPQAIALVGKDDGAIPRVIFDELVSYLRRTFLSRDIDGLKERLRILRYVYGLSVAIPGGGTSTTMSFDMLNTLWGMCSESMDEREHLMHFIAVASQEGKPAQYDRLVIASSQTSNNLRADPPLSSAFDSNVRNEAFRNLFCALDFDYDRLGEQGYRSFHFLFRGIRDVEELSRDKKISLDALWKICLHAGDSDVATHAMKDLLAVYSVSMKRKDDQTDMVTDENEESFGERMFQCLERVKINLEANALTARRSVERCMRILNAAVSGFECKGVATAPTLYRLSTLSRNDVSLDEFQALLPHGLRGHACYRRIGIMVNKAQHQNVSAYNGQTSGSGVPKFVIHVHPLETLHSLKAKVAHFCRCMPTTLRLVQIHGRVKTPPSDPSLINLSIAPEEAVMDEIGIAQGCEVVFDVNDRSIPTATPVSSGLNRRSPTVILSEVFFAEDGHFANRLFSTILSMLEVFPVKASSLPTDSSTDIYELIWNILLSMPTNHSIVEKINFAQRIMLGGPSRQSDAMDIDMPVEKWSSLLLSTSFDRSVYILLTIDAMLLPAVECLSVFTGERRLAMEGSLKDTASRFRFAFIESGGYKAVADFFSTLRKSSSRSQKSSRGNAVAMRILKACLLGDISGVEQSALAQHKPAPDDVGFGLLGTLKNNEELLTSLVSMVVDDAGITTSTVADVLCFVRILFIEEKNARVFADLIGIDRFFVTLLMWDESGEIMKSSAISASCHVRRSTEDLLIQTPPLADRALSWLIGAVESIDLRSESTEEFFNVLEKLVLEKNSHGRAAQEKELRSLSLVVANRLAQCTPPSNDKDLDDTNTGVLSGCLQLLRALIEVGGSELTRNGSKALVAKSGNRRWSELYKSSSKNALSKVPTPFSSSSSEAEDASLVDLIGAIFDGFLCSSGQSAVAICCDKESRRRGFDVIKAGARACNGPGGYKALIDRVGSLIGQSTPKLRHRWGQYGGHGELRGRSRLSKYSGLRNQGCTCYMNSFLQQLFMMMNLRDSLCFSPLPKSLRSSGSGSKGFELVDQRVSLQWENGVSYEAKVEAFNEVTGMHTIRYFAIPPTNTQHVTAVDIDRLPPQLADEFILSEGRIGKETGTFEIVTDQSSGDQMETDDGKTNKQSIDTDIIESSDEADSRRLLEEVQRTFIHLQEGSRGHCFDPRSLVEACAFLKLEFDVWQQNDASEFATKLLDRLEIALKKWAPESFRNLDHTFGLKQTKQKVCKKCGMKSNREEKFLSLDCQIRGKKNIHEALSSMTEVEIMEGSNQVHCDHCMENTDTVLRTAISTFPNMLILSLKRFDLDFNTFETVKLNSRCAFDENLNMKQYSLAAIDMREEKKVEQGGVESMVSDEESSAEKNGLDDLPDEDFQYRLVGVLVHAGVAQGGHYYSFIKDRKKGEESWYRFDDEDVTPFDPKNIETECFGGKVKKDVKYANGLVQTEEQDQIANALMLFYEKVKPTIPPEPENKEVEVSKSLSVVDTKTGYEAFEPDVRLANATHQLQSFLFDTEFQSFLKGILMLCMPRDNGSEKEATWRPTFIGMLLTFVYDVLVYSSDWAGRSQEWAAMFEDVLLNDMGISLAFINVLAKKTFLVSDNWIRSSLIECPDALIRNFSVRVISAALRSTLSSIDEVKLLHGWVRAWREQMCQARKEAETRSFIIPARLEGKFRAPESVENSSFSSIGSVLSHLNELVDALPRCWRFSPELCVLIYNIATMANDRNEFSLRRAMLDSQMPIRLVGFLVRDRPPTFLRQSCPGACISNEIAATQVKPESSAVMNVMPMGGSSMMNTHEFNTQNGRLQSTNDCMVLMEALAAFLGLDHAVRAPILEKADESNHSRHWYNLNEATTTAVDTIFHDLQPQGLQVLRQHEVENYLHCSGIVDMGGFSQQRAAEVLSKYGMREGDGSAVLTLDGFRAFHRDILQSGDSSLRRALHVYGYRPNLTRRSIESRRLRMGERDIMRPTAQSITIDVSELLKDRKLEPGPDLCLALLHADQLYFLASDLSEPLMSYILAAFSHNRDVEILIDRILTEIYLGRKDWEGNKYISHGSLMLQIIAGTPGPQQQSRIARIMNSNVKPIRSVDQSGGILMVLRTCTSAVRHNQLYGNDYHWMYRRYIEIVKEMRTIHPIVQWMNDNRSSWAFIERDLDSRGSLRVDYRGHDPVDTNITNSDSDMHGGNDSEDDDDDSQYDATGALSQPRDHAHVPQFVFVSGAGREEVNGKYKHIGSFEDYAQYMKRGVWGSEAQKFSIFLCHVSNNTKHWYISIIPNDANPGTSSDIDFYTAPMGDHGQYLPPPTGWVKAAQGLEPAPKLSFRPENDVANQNDTGPGHHM